MNRNRFIQGLKSDIQFSEKERQRIIRNSIKKYPWKLKCTVAMEEFAELQQQVSKQIRGYGEKSYPECRKWCPMEKEHESKS